MNVRRVLSDHGPQRLVEIDGQIENHLAQLRALMQERQDLSLHMALLTASEVGR
jgi:hypothetical protein